MAYERELLIKILVEAAQALATTESVKEKIGEVAAVQETAASSTTAAAAALEKETAAAEATTKALDEQATAAKNVETILETKARIAEQAATREVRAQGDLQQATIAANFAMQDLGEVTAGGGKKMQDALLAARDAVAALEVAQQKYREAGGAVPPQNVALLKDYDGQIQRLSGSLEKGTTTQSSFKTQADLTQGSVYGASRALASAAKDADSLAGSFARIALPVGAAIGIIALIPELLNRLDEGSKKVAAGIVDLINGFDDEALAVRRAGESQEQYEIRLNQVANRKAALLQASVAMGAGILQETTNTELATTVWQAHLAAISGVFEAYPGLTKALREMGITVTESFETARLRGQAFAEVYMGVLARDGVAAAEQFARSNKAALEQVITSYQNAGAQVPPQLLKIAQAIDLITQKEQEAVKQRDLHQKFLDEANAAQFLIGVLQTSATTFGSEATAVLGLRKEVVEHIAALEKLKTSSAAEEAQRKTMLATLTDLAVRYGVLPGKLGEIAEATDAVKEKIAELSGKLDENRAAFQRNLEKIDEHRVKAVTAARQTSDAAAASVNQQIADLNRQYTSHAISQAEFNEKFAALQLEQVNIRRAAEEQEAAINEEALKQRDELIAKDNEVKAAILKNLEELGSSAQAAALIRKELLESEKERAAVLQEQQRAEAALKDAVDESVKSQRDFKVEIEAVAKGAAVANTELAGHVDRHSALHTAIPATARDAADLGTQFRSVAGSDVPALNSAIDLLNGRLQALRAELAAVGAQAAATFGAGAAVP